MLMLSTEMEGLGKEELPTGFMAEAAEKLNSLSLDKERLC